MRRKDVREETSPAVGAGLGSPAHVSGVTLGAGLLPQTVGGE